jgi:hypothetical protein
VSNFMVMKDTQVRGNEFVIWQHICQPTQQSDGNINASFIWALIGLHSAVSPERHGPNR